MKLQILPITAENRAAACTLAVTVAQRGQIESVAACLTEADECPLWCAVGLYDSDTLVGFAMYGDWPEESGSRLWFDRFMIDAQYQGRGYGKRFLSLLLQRLELAYKATAIYLSVLDPQIPAVSLYQSNGFTFNGELDPNGEYIMVYHKG